jgi:serine/threonine protein phosphatase PrpC
MIDDETIRKIMAENREDLEQCCNKLIAAANENGGTDNVTVVCVEVRKQ